MQQWILPMMIFLSFLFGLIAYTPFGQKAAGVFAGIEFLLMVVCCLVVQTPLTVLIPRICGFGIAFTLDGFRIVYGLVAVFMWFMVTILSGEYFEHHENVGRFYLFLFWTLGATLGVFLSADFFTTFLFFEIMSFTSYVWVAQEENRVSLEAAGTYLAVAVIGGLVMLMGIFLLYAEATAQGLWNGSSPLFFDELRTLRLQGTDIKLQIAGYCILFGFGAKAGAFPLHIWLPKAHPVAPAPASALLSGILTKTGIYGILILTCQLFLWESQWGKTILLLGVITMFGGAVLAVFSIDLKRTLACSSMSQIGFILIGIGMQALLGEENALAVHGTLLHMVNHSMIKLVLFMAAGVIYMNTHALDLNRIRGYGRKKPLLKGIFLVGALAIGGIPLFAGYVSKTLLHEAIVEYGSLKTIEIIFLISGGLTVAYMTKLFIAIFIEKNNDAALQEKYDTSTGYMRVSTGLALTISAVVLAVWGLLPNLTMDRVAALTQGFMGLSEYGETVHYFALHNMSGGLISIAIGAVVYLVIIRKLLMKDNCYTNPWPEWLDLEKLLYKPILFTVLPIVFGVLCRILDSLVDGIVVSLRKTILRDSKLPHERTEGNFLTEFVGRILNRIERKGNISWNKEHPRKVNYVHQLALKREEFRENNKIIARSLSFGLFLFGVGLMLTLFYLIWL